MSTSGTAISVTPNGDKVRAALTSRWDTVAPVEYDGSNYGTWKEAVVRAFTTRRAKWILSGRVGGDNELNEIALSVLQGSLSTEFKYLLDDATCVTTAYKSICDHTEAQMRARLSSLRRMLSSSTQGDMSATAFMQKVNERHTDLIRAGGTKLPDTDIIDLIVFGLSDQFVAVKQQHALKPYGKLLELNTPIFSLKYLLSRYY